MAVSVTQLGEVLFLRDLKEKEMAQIAEITDIVEFNKDDVVIRQDDEADCIYIVIEGELSVIKKFGDKEEKLTNVARGAIIGEVAFITESRRSATIKALTYVKMLKISRNKFQKLIDEESIAAYKVVYRLAHTLSYRLVRASEKLVELSGEKKDKKEVKKKDFFKFVKDFFSHD